MVDTPVAEKCVTRSLVERARPVVDAMREKHLTLVTAESCTAGLVAAILSHAPRVGECLHGGFVVYSKEQKTRTLGVDPTLLSTQGGVNAAVALQMAHGAQHRSSADVSLAVTGVLGPDPDEDQNPAGLVYLAACRRGFQPLTRRLQLGGCHPDAVRRGAIEEGLALLRQIAQA